MKVSGQQAMASFRGRLCPRVVFVPFVFAVRPRAPDPGRGVYGFGAEARSVNHEIGDFDYGTCRAFLTFVRAFGGNVRLKEVKGIMYSAIAFLRDHRGVNLPRPTRNTKRSLPLLFKYMEDHHDDIAPLFRLMTLCDQNKQPLLLTDGTDDV
jgi:hypothetical protein